MALLRHSAVEGSPVGRAGTPRSPDTALLSTYDCRVTVTQTRADTSSGFRRGDRVRLKSLDQIEATLDAEGRNDGLSFMREMLPFRGRILEVASRADKTCDTVNLLGCNRQMSGTVHIEGARCDGSAHVGCQAYCNLFFKEAWLERVPEGSRSVDAEAGDLTADLGERLDAYADAGPNHYRCQATQLLEATRPMKGLGHYITDLRTRPTFVRITNAGVRESHVHDVTITKEAPNYRVS